MKRICLFTAWMLLMGMPMVGQAQTARRTYTSLSGDLVTMELVPMKAAGDSGWINVGGFGFTSHMLSFTYTTQPSGITVTFQCSNDAGATNSTIGTSTSTTGASIQGASTCGWINVNISGLTGAVEMRPVYRGFGQSSSALASSVTATGPAADGAAVSGNPVRIAGKDGSGNTQDIMTNPNGNLALINVTGSADALNDAFYGKLNAGDTNGFILGVAPSALNPSGSWDRVRTGSATSTDPHFGAEKVSLAGGAYTLQASGTVGVTTTGTYKTGLGGFHQHVIELNVTAAERDSADETYDFYIQMGDGVASWDVAHFTQIATTGAKQYVAVVNCDLLPQTITTASPGVSAVRTGTMKTDTSGANEGVRTLTAGMTQHGVCGDRMRYDLVIAGTVATGVTFSITATSR